jgi:hypothetical protein
MAEVFFPDKGEATTLKDADLHLIAIENSGTYSLQKAKHSTVEAEIIRNDKDAEFNDLTVGGDADFSGASSLVLPNGTFEPTFTFSTAGDLSVVYGRQEGRFEKTDDKVDFFLSIIFTPTFTTSSGLQELVYLSLAELQELAHALYQQMAGYQTSELAKRK